MSQKLNPKQELFVLEYLKDFNGTQACIRAGYSEKGASVQANQLLSNPKICDALYKAKQEVLNVVKFDAVDVLREIRDIALADITEAYDDNGKLKSLKDIPPNVRKAINAIDTYADFTEGVEVGETKRVRFIDKTKALDMAGRHFKMFTDKVDAKVEVDLKSSHADTVVEQLSKVFNALKSERKG